MIKGDKMKNQLKAITGLLTAAIMFINGSALISADSMPWESSDVQALNLRTNTSTLTVDEPYKWFSFTPSVTSYYEIRSCENEGLDYDAELYTSGGIIPENEYFYYICGEIRNFAVVVSLNAGETYYIKAGLLNDDSLTEDTILTINVTPTLPGETATTIYNGSAYFDAKIDGFSNLQYEWVDEEGNVLSEINTFSDHSTRENKHLICKISLQGGIPASVDYYIRIDNRLNSDIPFESINHMVREGGSHTINSIFSGDDLSGATYSWNYYTPSDYMVDVCTDQNYTITNASEYGIVTCTITDKYSNEKSEDFYLYVLPHDPNVVNAGTTYSLNLFANPVNVYAFTPQTSGEYFFSSRGEADTYFALFDSDLNCIGMNHDYSDENIEWSVNFGYKTEMEAGKTYYFVIRLASNFPVGPSENNGNLNTTFSIVRTSEPANNSTNPIAAPTVVPEARIPDMEFAATTEQGVSGFVERLYTIALGRPSDPAGKQNWIDAITLRGETGASCARGFLYSPEFLNKNRTTEEFVTILYKTFFDRQPDQAGFNAWVNALKSGTSKEEVIEGFINSTEWANLCLFYGIRSGGSGTPSIEMEPNQQTINFATRLYTTCLGRSADQAGLTAWARQLANQRDTGTGAAHGFFFSSEFTGQNVSNGEFVRRLYLTFMDREPDQAGYDAWVAQLDGGTGREEVFRGFADSIEFARICASYGIVR